jgi:soluble lytic murein transglycosylase-like protein
MEIVMKQTIIASMLCLCLTSPALASKSRTDLATKTNSAVTAQKSPKHKIVPPNELIENLSAEYGVDPALVHGIIAVESGHNCSASVKGGARGPMGVLPSTARKVGVHGELTDCTNGLVAGIRYLKEALTLSGDGCPATSAYNTGALGSKRCTAYGRRVIKMADQYRAKKT